MNITWKHLFSNIIVKRGEAYYRNGDVTPKKTAENSNTKTFYVQGTDLYFGRKKPVDVVIRPEDIIIAKPGSGVMDGVVTSNVFIGVHYEMCIEAGGFEWLAQNTVSYPVGTQVSIDVLPENIQIMHKPQSEDEQAIVLEDFE